MKSMSMWMSLIGAILLIALAGCTSEDEDETPAPAPRAELAVSLGTASPGDQDVAVDANDVSVLQIELSAGADRRTRITSITFTEAGTGDPDTAIGSLGLYVDADEDGAYASAVDTVALDTIAGGYDAGGTATFSSVNRTLDAGTSECWILVYSFNGTASVGDTFTPGLALAGDVAAEDADSGDPASVSGPPVTGNTATVENIGSLTLSTGANNPSAADLPTPATGVPMLQVSLEAGATEDVTVTSITFTAGGTGDADNDVSSVDLYDDVDGSGTVSAGDGTLATGGSFSGGTVQFSGLSETILAGGGNAQDWLVTCTFTGGTAGNTYSVSLASNGDVTATGGSSMLPVTPTGAPVNGNLMTMLAAPLVITTQRLPFAMIGSVYGHALQRTGGTPAFTWSVSNGTLPAGLTLGANTGVISGTPSNTATGQIFTVQVTDSAGTPQSDTQVLAIEVDPQGATIASVAKTGGTYNENVDLSYTQGLSGRLVLRSAYNHLPTVQASNASDHVIDVQTGMTSVWGLKITGASGSGMCGIKAQGSLLGIQIRDCILFGNDIAIDNSGNPGTSVENNTCYGPNGLYLGGGGSCMVHNNIVWATATNGWCHREYATPASSCDYNLYYAPNGHVGYDGTNYYTTLSAWQTHSGNDTNGQYGDPNFVNAAGGDFHLTTSSTLAIDQGTTVASQFTDAEGYARNQGAVWDIGAFEKH